MFNLCFRLRKNGLVLNYFVSSIGEFFLVARGSGKLSFHVATEIMKTAFSNALEPIMAFRKCSVSFSA